MITTFRRQSWGPAVRDRVDRFFTYIHPFISFFIPNFKVAHYSYVLLWIIIGSIFIYPVRNMPYIDALFFATGSATQSGLNPVDVNNMSLWQQMCLYIVTTLTTPIFIHGSLLFIRLYSFERFFDNIKETSKLNNQMRRTATLGSRVRSFDSVGVNTMANTGYNLNLGNYDLGSAARNGDSNTNTNTNVSTSTPAANDDHMKEDLSEKETNSPGSSGSSPTDSYRPAETVHDPDVVHVSEPSDEDEPTGVSFVREKSPSDIQDAQPHIQFPVNLQHPNRSSHVATPPPTHDRTPVGTPGGIRFGNLPQPAKREYEIDPSEMYRSIEYLQQSKNNADDEDDVLIIKSPNEIENEDESNPIFTRKAVGRKFRKKVKSRFKKMRTMSMNSIEDETGSIDSNDHTGIDDTMDARDGGSESDNDDYDSEEDDDGEENGVQRATSHLVLPSGDASGQKYKKRANTFDERENITGRTTKFSEPVKPSRQRGRKFNLTPRTSRNSADEELTMSHTLTNQLSRSKTANYLSWEPTIGRNSNFVHLTEEQKEELGGVEYRAIKLLIKIVWSYYIGWHIIALLVYTGWILNQPEHQAQLRSYGISPVWWGIFMGQTAFNDLGYTLTPNSMLDFNKSVYVLLWGAFFIVIGNTGFPVVLRFIIWVLFKFSKPLSLFQESLAFLLDHPRRCFTLLFPSGPTWWLFAILIILNGIDLIFFIILDLNNKYLESIPTGYRVMCGLFNAVSTRTAGLSSIDLSQLHSAVQVSYLIMMYISVMPLAISIRRTNVYEEQSLGVYIKDPNSNDDDINEKSPTNFIGNHLRHQLSFDLWFVFLGLFIICIAENSKLEANDTRFSVFAILFECVSAYGTVGLSLGYPTVDTSFSGRLTVISKLVIIAMMIRGRHRGLPYSLDRAILLPNDDMARRDKVQETHVIRRNETLEASPTITSGAGTGLFKALSRRGNDYLRRRSTIRRPSV